MATTTNIGFLRRIPLFKDFDREELDSIQSIFLEREYKKNQVIFMEEETGNYMYIVKYGEVKAVKTSADGRENIVAIHHTGETFGEMSLLDGNTSPATIVAMEDCRIIYISRQHFETILMKNPKVIMSMLRILCEKLRLSWKSIQALKYTDAETRLKIILSNLARTDGVPDDDGTRINMKITHQSLAEMAGTSRETISRMISRLQNQNLLKMSSRKFVLLDHPYWREL